MDKELVINTQQIIKTIEILLSILKILGVGGGLTLLMQKFKLWLGTHGATTTRWTYFIGGIVGLLIGGYGIIFQRADLIKLIAEIVSGILSGVVATGIYDYKYPRVERAMTSKL